MSNHCWNGRAKNFDLPARLANVDQVPQLGDAEIARRSAPSLVAMTRQRIMESYEPVFGGIVAALALVLLCFLTFTLISPHAPSIGVGYLIGLSASSIAWGVGQILGNRRAQHKKIPVAPPLLGSALGCVLVGLLMVLVTVFLHIFSSQFYFVAFSGVAAFIFLSVGIFVGIREGVWRNT